MGRVRGFHDIKTHGTLAREERLVSVARDWHRIQSGGSSEERLWDGSIERMVFERSAEAQRLSRNLFQDIGLEKRVLATQIKQVQELIAEMEGFVEEGLPGALVELNRLKTKLSRLESV